MVTLATRPSRFSCPSSSSRWSRGFACLARGESGRVRPQHEPGRREGCARSQRHLLGRDQGHELRGCPQDPDRRGHGGDRVLSLEDHRHADGRPPAGRHGLDEGCRRGSAVQATSEFVPVGPIRLQPAFLGHRVLRPSPRLSTACFSSSASRSERSARIRPHR